MATYYTQQARGVAKGGHIGTQCADAKTATGLTVSGAAAALGNASVGDLIYTFKVPVGAVLEDLVVKGVAGAASVNYDVGYDGNPSLFGSLALAAASSTARPSGDMRGFVANATNLSLAVGANEWLLSLKVAAVSSVGSAASWVAQLSYHMD